MEKKQYTSEASYLRVVHNWRQACDKRGISDALRSQYNQQFLDYILDDLMPYHKDEGLNDFSLLEVNRYAIGTSIQHLPQTVSGHLRKDGWQIHLICELPDRAVYVNPALLSCSTSSNLSSCKFRGPPCRKL